MPIPLIGGGIGHPPFNRTFFSVTLGDVLGRTGKEQVYRLTLYLMDGTALDVCHIDGISDDFLMVRSYVAEQDACDTRLNLLPYPLIYRIELSPKKPEDAERMGFRWTPPSKRAAAR